MVIHKLKINAILKRRGCFLSMSILAVLLILLIQSNALSQTVNATSSLPGGCAECQSITPTVTPSEQPGDPYGKCGDDNAGVTYPVVFSTTYTVGSSPCFDNGKWKEQLVSVNTPIAIERNCPSNLPTILCLGDVAGLTKAQACAQLARYPNPIPATGLNLSNSDCWCRDCVAAHEEAHLTIDIPNLWVQQSLQPEINIFIIHLNSNGVDVNCGTPDTLNCSTAITNSVRLGYDANWQARLNAAAMRFNSVAVEGPNGYAAEVACYQQIINALTVKCNAP